MNQIVVLKKLTGEEDEEILQIMLERAKNVILSRRFPFGDWPTREVTTVGENGEEVTEEETYVEPCFLDLQVRIAESMYNRRGMEGEISHSTNGTSRSFETDGVPLSLLREIVPFVKVIS